LHPRFRHKLALFFGLVSLLSTSTALGLIYEVTVRSTVSEFGQKLAAIAASGAVGIDGDAFATLRDPQQMDSATYQQIQAHLRRLKAANSHINLRFVYTMAPTSQPTVFRYVVDAEPPNSPEFSALGDTEYYAADEVIPQALQGPAAEPDVKFHPDWGNLLIAAAPIRDHAGQVVGVVGVDAPADSVEAIKSHLRRITLVCLFLGLALSAAASFVVGWGVTRPLTALVAATRAVAGGNLQYRVVLPNRDEFGQLGESFNQMTEGLRQRDLYKEQFGRYVSRQIADKILEDPERSFWQGERRRATILFSDIRDFTATAEHLPPEEVVSRLNEYLSAMIDIVFTYDGTLDKFIGDAVMAVFGAPVSLGNDEERAVRAAVAMQQVTDALSRSWAAEGKPPLRIGIGIATGDVVVGNVGSERRMEYSVIGDYVNLASRLEQLNKEYNTGILISESTYAAVADLVESRLVDHVVVRGRTQPVAVYEVRSMREPVLSAAQA
jgi:class 3 adenylate cyclase